MCASVLQYEVPTDNFLTYWMISDIIEVPFTAKPVPTQFPNYHPGVSVKDENGKERVSPAKREYLEIGAFKNSVYPTNVAMDHLYYPFDTTRVDRSGVWKFPTGITFYACSNIHVNENCSHPFEIYASGAVKIWVNQKLAAEFYPYESNIEQKLLIELDLAAGENKIVVGCNDYGERNIVFKFGLRNMGGLLNVSLPIVADVQLIQQVNDSIQSLYLNKLSYTEGDITFYAEKPFRQATHLQINVADIEKTFMVPANASEILWGDVSELPIGHQEFEICTHVEQIELKTMLWAEVYPQERAIATPSTYKKRCEAMIDFAIQNSNSMDSYIAGLSKGSNDVERCLASIEHGIDLVQRRGDCADFRLLRFLWILRRYRSFITQEQAMRIEQLVLRFRYWFDEPGNDAMWFFSENHALAFHVDEYLAGEMYADRVFSNSNMTGRQHMNKAKKLIVEWFEKLLEFGYNEWNSATYISVDVMTYLTLFELSEDTELKELARRALDLTFEMYAKNSFKGVLGTSNGRTYPRDLLANLCLATNSQMWMAWGCANLNNYISPAIYMALSSYRPPAHFAELAKWDTSQKYILTETQGSYKVATTVCKTKDYIIGTCISPRSGYFGSQEHLLNVFIGDASSRLWVNHPGESKIFGQRRPGYFTGNGLTPLVSQQNNVAVMSYNFPQDMLKRAEVNFTHMFCDKYAYDRIVMDSNWIFLQKQNAYVAFYSTAGIQPSTNPALKNCELVSNGINGTWFIKVSCQSEIESFEAFIEYMRAHTPVCKNDTLYYTDYEYGAMEFDLMEEDYSWKVMNSDVAKELGLRNL